MLGVLNFFNYSSSINISHPQATAMSDLEVCMREQVLVMGWVLFRIFVMNVVRCGRLEDLVVIVLLFIGVWRLSSRWG